MGIEDRLDGGLFVLIRTGSGSDPVSRQLRGILAGNPVATAPGSDKTTRGPESSLLNKVLARPRFDA